MLRLDKIFFEAITADADLMQAVGGRVKSTCFEVSPMEQDNTPLPYILIMDEGKAPSQTTKDDGWMPYMWRVGAGVLVSANSQYHLCISHQGIKKEFVEFDCHT